MGGVWGGDFFCQQEEVNKPAELQVRVYTLDQGMRAALALCPGAACCEKRAVGFLYPGLPHTLDPHALDPAGIPWTRVNR